MRLKSKIGREFEGQVNIFCNVAGYNNHFIYNLSLNSVLGLSLFETNSTNI